MRSILLAAAVPNAKVRALQRSTKPTHANRYQMVSYDKPQNIALSGIWDFATQANKLLNSAIGGWTMNFIYRFPSGNPVDGMDTLNSRPELLLENQTKDHWFNNDRACYRTRAPYTLRTVQLRYSWLRQMASSLFGVGKDERAQ